MTLQQCELLPTSELRPYNIELGSREFVDPAYLPCVFGLFEKPPR
jgi:hypothetical protein